jgi:deoxyribodipyrimidine photolyase-related protein
MSRVAIVFPHQLFEESALLREDVPVYLVEEFLFFKQYPFHKQKLVFHRASMKQYHTFLLNQKKEVVYVESHETISDIRKLIPHLQAKGFSQIVYQDTTDYLLERRMHKACESSKIALHKISSSLFLKSTSENNAFFDSKKRMFQTDYYISQRKTKNILLEGDGKPLGGQWSYDAENREKYPKGKQAPKLQKLPLSPAYKEAKVYVEKHFGKNYGAIDSVIVYPTTHQESKQWLKEFLEQRFAEFGPYEDAMVAKEYVLHHSVLTPMLNAGLITPKEIVDTTLDYAQKNQIPIATVEGFIRQIIGWREFIRAVYERKGVEERTRNYWGFTQKMPESFWTATTGIVPVDNTIKKLLETGYNHHIERLMILGNFMLLCEIDPNEVYEWFMTMYIDAYDWVMVPNVYGMSQFADGGLMATKPYISGSNYVLKMSDYAKGDWCKVWDALFWNFMNKQRNYFLSNPRLGMLIRTYDKMSDEKKNEMNQLVIKFKGNGFRVTAS